MTTTTHHPAIRVSPFALLVALLVATALPAHAQEEAAPRASVSAPEAAATSGAVNLNTATAEELTRLPGVGPSRAQAIIELRTRLKRFKRIQDLMRVRGIGRKTFRKLAPMLKLDGPTTLVEARPNAAVPR